MTDFSTVIIAYSISLLIFQILVMLYSMKSYGNCMFANFSIQITNLIFVSTLYLCLSESVCT